MISEGNGDEAERVLLVPDRRIDAGGACVLTGDALAEWDQLEPPPRLIRLFCETEHQSQKLWILLTDEESVIHKALERCDRSAVLR